MTQTSGGFVKQVVFLTVTHRGPLPLRELHSTDESRLWRDPGGSWACLPPVYVYGWNHRVTGCDTCQLRQEKNCRRKELYEMSKEQKQLRRAGPRGQGCDTDKWRLRKAGRFSYGESPRTPPLEGTSLHRWNKSVERPWGILSLFTTGLRLRVKSPCHRVWHMSTTPGKELREEMSHRTKRKNTRNKSWVEKDVKQDWKWSTQNRWRRHTRYYRSVPIRRKLWQKKAQENA